MTEAKTATIQPRKLRPPVDMAKKIITRETIREPRNIFIRFIKRFLGEGY